MKSVEVYFDNELIKSITIFRKSSHSYMKN